MLVVKLLGFKTLPLKILKEEIKPVSMWTETYSLCEVKVRSGGKAAERATLNFTVHPSPCRGRDRSKGGLRDLPRITQSGGDDQDRMWGS